MKFLRKAIVVLLSGCLVSQSAETWAFADLAPHVRPVASVGVFNAQALNPQAVSGYTGIPGSVMHEPATGLRQTLGHPSPLQISRREFVTVVTGAVVLIGGTVASAVRGVAQVVTPLSQTPTPTLEDARRFKGLLNRMLDVSPELRADLQNVRVAEKVMQAQAARNVAVQTSQADLTHAPRVPLGSSSATPGPGIPAVEDVIGRSVLQINGPVRKWESLERHQNGLVRNLIEKFRTAAFRGGYTRNNDAVVALSWKDYYAAVIDVEDAATKPFEHMDVRWQALQTKWFELGQLSLKLRQLESVRQFKLKQIADLQQRQKLRLVEDPLALQNSIFALESNLTDLRQEVLNTTTLQHKLASDIVVNYLRGADADKGIALNAAQYLPLLPDTRPTLAMIERILLDTDHRLDPKIAPAFRRAVMHELNLGEHEMPADPLDRSSRELVLDRLWTVKGHHASIPMREADSDSSYPSSASMVDELLALDGKDLLQRAPPCA